MRELHQAAVPANGLELGSTAELDVMRELQTCNLY